MVEALARVRTELQDGAMWLMSNGATDFDNAGAASTDFLHLFGYAALAYMWAMMSRTALDMRHSGRGEPFHDAKLITARYFVERVLPESTACLTRMKSGAASMMALPAEMF
jgi:hypothetical protein